MAKQMSTTDRILNYGGAALIYLLAFFTFLAVVLAIADVFGPAVR